MRRSSRLPLSGSGDSCMKGISIKAVIIATVVTFVLDTVIGIALVVMLGRDIPFSSLTEAEASEALRALSLTTTYLMVSMALGTLTTVNGGYLAGRLGGQLPYLNALAFGVVGVILGVMLSSGLPWWFIVLGLGLTLPAALLGGYLAKARG